MKNQIHETRDYKYHYILPYNHEITKSFTSYNGTLNKNNIYKIINILNGFSQAVYVSWEGIGALEVPKSSLGHYQTLLHLKQFPVLIKYLKYQNSQFGITSLSCAIYTEYEIEDNKR